MKFLLDFHYSDYWADPQQQNKPLAWVGENFPALKKSLYDYYNTPPN
jgi:arabinogalactan endo-1,4-beta-galactosidase